MSKQTIREEVTDIIVAELEKGTVPWIKPWASAEGEGGLPRNGSTGKTYRGVNVWLLTIAGAPYASSEWYTYRQAKANDGQVRKGEKGARVIFWKRIEKKTADDASEKNDDYWLLRSYTVFNREQIDGLPGVGEPVEIADFERHQVAEGIVASTGADIIYGTGRASYALSTDVVTLPNRERFMNSESFYAAAFHELGHWTGHGSRLNREGIVSTGARFGNEAYAFEELVAELTSAYLCAEHRIDGETQHPEYIASWLTVLKNDSNFIFKASSGAGKAADYINAGAASVQKAA